MKIKLYTLCLILLFLTAKLPGTAANETTSDTLNTEQLLKQLDSIRQKLKAAEASKPKSPWLVYPKVVSTGSMLKARPANMAVFNDYIYLKLDSLVALTALADSITGGQKDTMGDVILYINGNAMRDIPLIGIDQAKQQLIFHLDRHSTYLMKFYPVFPYLWSKVPMAITAGFRNGMTIPVDRGMKPLELKYVSSWSIGFSLLFVFAIAVLFIVLAAKTNLIRIGDDSSPFSLALTQLSFWSIVVASSFIYIWIVTDEMPPITGSTLILISVSALTTAGSRLVDVRTKTKSDETARSVSFFADILQDELGYSVHRAQMFMWTAIMGIIFVASVIRLQQIPQLDESLLAMMGISSGAYVGLKTMENKKPAEEPVSEEVSK
jgi:hypothetical protein